MYVPVHVALLLSDLSAEEPAGCLVEMLCRIYLLLQQSVLMMNSETDARGGEGRGEIGGGMFMR